MTRRSACSVPMLAVIFLVALRIAVGWYFFDGARHKKADRNFSSAGFLSQATGPFASAYKAKLPDFHDWRSNIAVPQKDEPNPHSVVEERDAWQAFNRRSYSHWLDGLVVDWGRQRQKATDHYDWDDAQRQQAGRVFDYYEGKLRSHLDANREEIEAYRHELYRLATWSRNDAANEVPFEIDRGAAKEVEIRGKASSLQAPVREMEERYLAELIAVATPEQLSDAGSLPVEPTALARFDRFLIFIHLAIGACLVVGLFTRLAALGAGLFLITVILSQPPWIVGYQIVGNQVIMMFACFLLMAIGAGRWAGLDYFLPSCCGCGSGKCATPKTEKSNEGTSNAST